MRRCQSRVDRELAVLDDGDLGSGFLQHVRDEALVVRAVLGQQDATVESADFRGSLGRRLRHHTVGFRRTFQHPHAVQWPRGDRQTEAAADAGFRLHELNITAQCLPQAFADRQPQPGPAKLARGGGIGLGKRLEQARGLLVGHAHARVNNVEFECWASIRETGRACDQTHMAEFGELDGVAHQVDEDLPQTG